MGKKEETKEEIKVIVEPLTPVKVEKMTVTKAEPEITVPDGYVYIVSVDANGNEKPNSGFFYPEKKYQRYYGDTTKFQVKKKATK